MSSSFKSLTINDTGYVNLPVGTSSNRTSANNATVVSFTTIGSTTWTAPAGVNYIEVLVVGGGGSGSGSRGASNGSPGGGGGGVIYSSAYPVIPSTTYTVVVGAGGTGGLGTAVDGTNGANSQFDLLIALGGGYGGGNYVGATNSINGGSSGGAGTTVNLALGTFGQGFSGGMTSWDSSNTYGGGGGGGAGGPGFPAANTGVAGGNGGPGVMYSITGTPTWYAGGGGGAYGSGGSIQGVGGRGGGGSATQSTYGTRAGGPNTGGGGGGTLNGAGGDGLTSAGGSGIVIIRYNLSTAINTDPRGQTRFNTDINSAEELTRNLNKTLPVNGESIVTNGLVLNLDPAKYISGSTWRDTSETGLDATLNGTYTYSPTANKGTFTFDGSTAYASRSNSSYLDTTGTQPFTVSIWFKTTTNARQYLIAQGDNNSDYTNNFQLFIDTTAFFSMGTGSSASYVQLSNAITIGKWYHMVGTFDGYNMTLYLNGQNVQSGTWSSTRQTGGSLYIGKRVGTGFTSGNIGPVQIYNRALTQSEVQRNYNTQLPRFANISQTPLQSFTRPAIVNDFSLVLNLDAADPASYHAAGNQSVTTQIDYRQWYDTANGKVFTSSNYPQWTPAWGGAWLLNGSNQNFTNNDVEYFATDGFTFEVWVYPNQVSVSQGILSVGTQNSGAGYANIYVPGSSGTNGASTPFAANTVRWEFFNNSGTAVDPSSTTALTTGRWYQIVTTVDQTMLKVYVNGVYENFSCLLYTSPSPRD